jgi:hypothetical protein
MITNGFYFYSSKARDGVVGGADGVMVVRDGTLLGGTEFFYFTGTYSCPGGRWKSYRQILVTAGPVRRRRLWADGRSAWR